MKSFALEDTNKLKRKHILVVDDVITTGSTFQGCAQKLLEIEGVKVSVGTLAVA